MKTKLITITLILITNIFTLAQKVENVGFITDDNKVIISYILSGTTEITLFDVELWVAPKCSNDFTKIPDKELKGDFGKNISAGTKYIKWYPTTDINYTNCCFKVKASYIEKAVEIKDNTTTTTIENLPEMVFVKGGTFMMGSEDGEDDEKPVHQVTLTDYYIGKYEVTNAEYAEFIFDYGQSTTKATSDYPNQIMIKDSKVTYSGSYDWGLHQSGTKWTPATGYEDYPVINVTWYGAYEYCKWLTEKTGKTYQLPSEAQWEYAAGGGASTGSATRTKWAGTSSEKKLGTYAWYESNSNSKTHKVGTKTANSLGIYDMSGNVWEWCLDWYSSTYYTSAAVKNPVNLTTSSYRVYRGGSWYSSASFCRIANRYYINPAYYLNGIGFRFVFSPSL